MASSKTGRGLTIGTKRIIIGCAYMAMTLFAVIWAAWTNQPFWYIMGFTLALVIAITAFAFDVSNASKAKVDAYWLKILEDYYFPYPNHPDKDDNALPF